MTLPTHLTQLVIDYFYCRASFLYPSFIPLLFHFLTTVRFQLTLYQTKGKPALMKVELDLWYGYIAQAK